MFPQSLDSLLLRHARLCHDQLDILSLDARVVDLLAIVIVVIVLLLAVTGVDSLAFSVVVRVPGLGVVVAGVVGALGFGELGGGLGVGLGV